MTRLLVTSIFLLALPLQALAVTTICTAEGELIGPSVISWDTDTRKAKIKLGTATTFEGAVTLTREHNFGTKTNLRFLIDDPLYSDELEFIVFPAQGEEYRVIGVGFTRVSGKPYLDVSHGNYKANCSSL